MAPKDFLMELLACTCPSCLSDFISSYEQALVKFITLVSISVPSVQSRDHHCGYIPRSHPKR